MNPNTRKRHDALPRCEQVPSTRKPTPKSTVSGKNRLFSPKNTIKESDNMTRIDHPKFRIYRDTHTRIRVARGRHVGQPSVSMPDGYTIQITRQRAARYLRDMRAADNKRQDATVTRTSRKSARAARKACPPVADPIARKKAARARLSDNRNRTESVSDNPTPQMHKRGSLANPESDNTPGRVHNPKESSRIWESWMRTQRKLTFAQYCARWLADNTA